MLSNTVGCSNKWSIVNTQNGIYFIDSNSKDIYLFNGSLINLSATKGLNTWIKNNFITKDNWTPIDFNNYVTYYDSLN